MMVPQPVEAVLMLFPITDATEKAKAEEEERLKQSGQDVSSSVWFSKQTVSNACGTVGMLHAYANSPDVKPAEGSFLQQFLEQSKAMSPEERARFLEQPKDGEPDIEEAHQDAAQGGQTAPPPEDEQVQTTGLLCCDTLCSCDATAAIVLLSISGFISRPAVRLRAARLDCCAASHGCLPSARWPACMRVSASCSGMVIMHAGAAPFCVLHARGRQPLRARRPQVCGNQPRSHGAGHASARHMRSCQKVRRGNEQHPIQPDSAGTGMTVAWRMESAWTAPRRPGRPRRQVVVPAASVSQATSRRFLTRARHLRSRKLGGRRQLADVVRPCYRGEPKM